MSNSRTGNVNLHATTEPNLEAQLILKPQINSSFLCLANQMIYLLASPNVEACIVATKFPEELCRDRKNT